MEDEILTIKEAAKLLRVSQTQIYRLIKEGELPVIKRGKRYTRLQRTDLLFFLERYRKEPASMKEVER